MKSNFDIEKFFGMGAESVNGILVKKEDFVSEFEIRKSNGKTRKITAPTGKYKYILKGLLYRFWSAYKPSDSAHGFVKSRGVSTNAEPHVGSLSVGSIDVEDFFGSIDEDHLKNAIFGNKRICKSCQNFNMMCAGKCHPSLYKNKLRRYDHMCEEIRAVFIPGYEEESGYTSLFNLIINASMYKGCTPQGFPTSPIISNLVMRGADAMLGEMATDLGVRYTRYADDLSFSSDTMKPSALSKAVKKKSYKILRKYRFRPNLKKTKFYGQGSRMLVCGVLVNENKSLPIYKVKNIRAAVHRVCVKEKETASKADIMSVRGQVSYLMSLNPEKGRKYAAQMDGLK